MAIVFLVLGGLFALVGLAGGVYSLDMLPTERGIAGTIASAVFVAGGIVTAAVGAAVHRLEALLYLLSAAAIETGPARTEPVPEDLRAEPPMAQPTPAHEPVSPPPVDIEIPKPAVAPVIRSAEPPPVDLSLSRTVQTAPRQLSTGAAVAAGAALATAGAAAAAATSVASTARSAVEDALAAPVPPLPKPVRPARQPEPELPVEVLPAIDTTLREIKEQEVIAHPAPVLEPVKVEADKSDPISDFVAELDRLIPLPAEKPVVVETPAAPEPVAVAVAEVRPEPKAEPAVPPPEAEEEAPEPQPEPQAEPAKPAAGADVIGAYESGGAKYTMYSDGSVTAEADGQTMRFNSLEELREFIDGGHKPA
jgi:hypothetical protein